MLFISYIAINIFVEVQLSSGSSDIHCLVSFFKIQ